MLNYYDDILFDEYGNSIPLSADDLIDYLTQCLYDMRFEKDHLEEQLKNICLILDPKKHLDNTFQKSSDFLTTLQLVEVYQPSLITHFHRWNLVVQKFAVSFHLWFIMS